VLSLQDSNRGWSITTSVALSACVGLRDIIAVYETRVAPGHARRVFRTRNLLFVLVRPRGTFLMPRRDFADAAAYRDFWNALQPLAAKKEKRGAA
jgi:hypothetical protein